MSRSPNAQRWCAGIGLGLAVTSMAVVCILLFYTNTRSTAKNPSVVEPLSNAPRTVADSAPPSIIEPAGTVMEASPKLPHLEFPPGSIEEVCGLNDFPPFHYKDPENKFDWLAALEDATCWSAIADHIHALNPYLFLWGEKLYQERPIAFVVLDEPLTFERIFADLTGDLARVQEALSNPECLLTEDQTNWELKETCHADAFQNYALINRFCFNEDTPRKRAYYWEEDSPTPEQDRFMWKQSLENAWLRTKCEAVPPTLELTEYNPELYQSLMSISSRKDSIDVRRAHASLIELAARLGDDTAGLTQQVFGITGTSPGVYEEGYKYGRFSWLLTSPEWRKYEWKRQPSTDRFLQTFNMLALLSGPRPDPIHDIKFDWKRVARHLCEPPYDESELYYREDEEIPESKSCKEIVHELRQRDIKFQPVLNALDKFEQVAIELGVYE